ncbi:hypothetical protein [Streptomyces qinzhouensis]|uniref:Uncharacterized protein n=1 Tax=Streptomyces qinzhouensis TaxID=2599401 RepID=A0A5B8IN80_9ACTN|nr:hypothetical protein [Streptomyces qinzhouensis]QDY78989.1 hypothetical protein FQU76_23485 [Streptomyces qinzhouensis]
MPTLKSPAPPGAAASPPRTPRAPRRHPLRAELLRGIGPWTGAAVALAVGLMLYEKADPDTDWQSHWSAGAELLRVGAVQFGGPIALAAGVWQGGRERRRGTLELRAGAARGTLRQTLVAVAPVVLWPVAVHLLGALVMVLAILPYASAGGPYGSVVVADSVALASCGVLGFVVGRLVAWRLAAPLLGIAAWLAMVGFQNGHGTRRKVLTLLNPADQLDLYGRVPVWWFAPASLLWTGGVAATVLLLYAARRRAFALVPLAAAVLGAATLMSTGDGLWRDSPALTRQVCTGQDPEICVTAQNRRLLPDVTAALSGVHAELRGVPGAPVRWTEAPDGVLKPGEAALSDLFGNAFRGRLGEPEAFAYGSVGALFGWCATERPGWERAIDITQAASDWLAPYTHNWYEPTPETKRHLNRLKAMTPAESRAYLTRLLASDRCENPGAVPAP